MATALNRTKVTSYKGMAVQCQQLQDNSGNAVDMTSLVPLATKVIAAGATKTLTAANAGQTIMLDTAAGSVVTLPPATGSGNRYKFVVKVLATSNSHEVAGDNTGTFYGTLEVNKAGTVTNYTSAGTNKSVKFLNDGTQGCHQIGDTFEVIDVDTNKYGIYGLTTGTGTLATPFSSTV